MNIPCQESKIFKLLWFFTQCSLIGWALGTTIEFLAKVWSIVG